MLRTAFLEELLEPHHHLYQSNTVTSLNTEINLAQQDLFPLKLKITSLLLLFVVNQSFKRFKTSFPGLMSGYAICSFSKYLHICLLSRNRHTKNCAARVGA